MDADNRSKAQVWPYRFYCSRVCSLALAWLCVWGSLLASGSNRAAAQTTLPEWSDPVTVSTADSFDWFSDIAVDSYGTPHMIWDAGLRNSEKALNPDVAYSMLMYSHRNRDEWVMPFDVVALKQDVGGGNIFRGALSADSVGSLYMLYQGRVSKSDALDAEHSAAGWSRAVGLAGGAVYMGSTVVDQNDVVHVLFDQLTGGGSATQLSEIYYSRSTDGARTWSVPTNFSNTSVGEHREKLKMGPDGTLFAMWDEGWDRLTERGEPQRGALKISSDNGANWSESIRFEEPAETNGQFVATGDGRGGILAVWRATDRNDVFYSWSDDNGDTWTKAQVVPGIVARPWAFTRFDSYDVVADSGNTIHLLAVGRRNAESESHLYHVMWDGTAWSTPQLLYADGGFPEWPRIVVSQGNHLHATWFVRDKAETGAGSYYQILYSDAISDAPLLPLPPVPESTATPTPLAAFMVATPTPQQFRMSLREADLLSRTTASLRSERDEYMLFLVSGVPILAITGYLFLRRRMERRM